MPEPNFNNCEPEIVEEYNVNIKFILLLAIAILLYLPASEAQSSLKRTTSGENLAPIVVPSIKNWTGGSGQYTLTGTSRIVLNKAFYSQLLSDANTFKEDLFSISGLDITIVNGGTPVRGDLYLTLGSVNSSIGNEGYELTIQDYISISSKTTDGLFYGMQTVLQALNLDNGRNNIPKGSCIDWPDFPIRALMVDPARRFLSVSYMENWIRRLAWYKMNYFHIHFTDSEGFRLQCDIYPGLTSADGYYSLDDIARFEAIAAKYHVSIIPEIDMPGHASHIRNYDSTLFFTDANIKSVLNVTSKHTRDWLSGLLNYYLPKFSGKYFHIGTDEFPVPYHPLWPENVYSDCKQLTEYQKSKGYAQPMDVFVEFMNWTNDIIRSHGKTTRMWHWFDWAPNGIYPDSSIEIDLWEPAWERPLAEWDGYASKDPAWFAGKGYKLLNSSEAWNYCVPERSAKPEMDKYFGVNGSITNFHTGIIPAASCTGGKINLWGDNEYGGKTEAQINAVLIPYVGAMGETTWGGPAKSDSLALVLTRVTAAGEPPAYKIHNPHSSSEDGRLTLKSTLR